MDDRDHREDAACDPLPSFSIDTRRLPRNTAFSLWQDEVIPYWEAQPQDRDTETFESATESYLIGDMMLGTVRTPSQRIGRSRYRIARDGLSQYGLQFIIEGGIGKRDGGSERWAGNKGDLLVSDLAQTQTLEARDLHVLYFSVPRDRLAPLLDRPDHHNERVVSANAPLMGLLNTHLATALDLAPSLDTAQAQAVMNVTLELTAAVLNAQATEAQADAIVTATMQAIRRHVEEHIRNPRLSADAVAARFGMSRRKLYYLFEPFGGFASYVRDRRLHHVRAALTDPANRSRSIAEIAEAFGFIAYPGFVRAFRRIFDVSPREARALAGQGHLARRDMTGDNIWRDWLLQTR